MESTSCQKTKRILEARLNRFSGTEPCFLCNRFIKRTRGTMETYLRGTLEFVCFNCALKDDWNLAVFAYAPDKPRSDERNGKRVDTFGGCPECSNKDSFYELGAFSLCICCRHGLMWVWQSSGSVSSGDVALVEGYAELSRFKLVDGYYGEPPRVSLQCDKQAATACEEPTSDRDIPF